LHDLTVDLNLEAVANQQPAAGEPVMTFHQTWVARIKIWVTMSRHVVHLHAFKI